MMKWAGLLSITGVFAFAALTSVADKKLGLFKDERSLISDGMVMTLNNAGYATTIITRDNVQKGENLDGVDVIFLPGGWNAVDFIDFNGRKNLVDFVARGKGVLSGAFRSGYCRTANRPLFPQVGAVYNRVGSPAFFPEGGDALCKGLDRPFFVSGWDHMVVRAGEKGKVFLKDVDGLPVGVAGEIYGGRYIALGAFIGMDAKTAPMEGPEKTLLLNALAWLEAAPKLSAAETAENRTAAELDFLRREKIYDYTLNDQGPDYGPGVITTLENSLEIPLAAREYRFEYCLNYLEGKDREAAIKGAASLNVALNKLARRHREVVAEKTNAIDAMSREALLADNPFVAKDAVRKAIDAVAGKSAEEKKQIKTDIDVGLGRNSYVNAPRRAAMFLYGDKIKEELFPAEEWRKILKTADERLAELEPKVAARKAAVLAEARAKDLAEVPALMEQCSAKDVESRREAAMELGRIGDKRATDTLIKLLDDPDEQVRVNAVLALGWLQAESAVPKLIETAKSEDVRLRRRAGQALGQIGDKRAIPALLEAIKDADHHVRENAILSLGWLKAEEAVPALLEIVTTFDREEPYQRGLMIAAARALGHIGDKRALPRLEYWAKIADDFPASRGDKKKRITNLYATAQELGLRGHAELAIAEIKSGGRRTIGVAQNARLAAVDKFYGLKKNLNFFVGRPMPLLKSNFSDASDFFAYLYNAGATGVHNAWGTQDYDQEMFLDILRKADAYDMRWIEVMPQDGNYFGARQVYKEHRQEKTLNKAGAELVLLKFADTPAFQGFWTEEDYPPVKMTDAEFEKYLTKKYGADFRKKLDLAADGKGLLPGKERKPVAANYDARLLEILNARNPASFANKKLYAEFLEFSGVKLLDEWREAQEWARGARKGCAFTFSQTTGVRFTYIGVYGKASGVIDGHGPESYQSFGSDNAFMMELAKDGEARPVMCEFYNMYSPTLEHAARGFAQHLVHGECFYNFSVEHIFGQAGVSYMWGWDRRRWDKAKEIFRKARALKEYLSVPASAANVAQLASERSQTLFYSRTYGEVIPVPRRYYENQAGVWSALQQSHIPADAIWTETMTAEKLGRYKVLSLADAKCLTPKEVDLLRQWVKAGGVLIAGGSSSLFDQWGELQKNYALADVFGVNYAGHVAETDPNKIDTYCLDAVRPLGQTRKKAIDPGLNAEKSRPYVPRDIKPILSIGIYSVVDNSALPGVAKGAVCEYDMPLGYDKVTLNGATTLATFAVGDPAVTVNKYGKGLCYFWTPIYSGLCHTASGWEIDANFKDFWPGVRELLAAMVQGGLDYRAETLPVSVSACPKNVEIVVRRQPDKGMMMIHLLNLDPNLSRVAGLSMIARPPKMDNLKVFYPDTGDVVSYVRTADGVLFAPRPFEVHDMLVVEYPIINK